MVRFSIPAFCTVDEGHHAPGLLLLDQFCPYNPGDMVKVDPDVHDGEHAVICTICAIP